MVLQCKLRPSIARINVQLDPRHAASKHTTASINYTRPSPRKLSPDGAARARKHTSNYNLLLSLSTLKGWKAESTCASMVTNQHINNSASYLLLSEHWHYWLRVRKSICAVKCEWWCASMVICLKQMICIWSSWCNCHPIISCLIKIQNCSAFLMPAYPGCPLNRCCCCSKLFDEQL